MVSIVYKLADYKMIMFTYSIEETLLYKTHTVIASKIYNITMTLKVFTFYIAF